MQFLYSYLNRAFIFLVTISCSFYAKSDVSINTKWIKETETVYGLSIAPRGQVSNPFGSDGRGMKCIQDGGCIVEWILLIYYNDSNTYRRSCPTTMRVSKGTTIETLMPQINARMMEPCTFPAYDFKGGEKLCVMLKSGGSWQGTIVGALGLVFAYSESHFGVCGWSGSGGSGGGGVMPPVKPATCQTTPLSISLQHPTLNASEVNGHRKEVNVNISCSRKSSVNLKMTGLNSSGRLALDKNGVLFSALTINGVSARQGVNINNVGTSGTNVTIASTLVSKGEVSFGNYSASAVLEVTIP